MKFNSKTGTSEGLTTVFHYLKGNYRGVRLFSEVDSKRTRGTHHSQVAARENLTGHEEKIMHHNNG